LKKAQQLKPNLYDGSVIGKSDVIVVPDSENTLMHAEESRSKMITKQNNPQLIEKKTESYAEQAFWSQYSMQIDEPTHSGTTIVEVPKEFPKVNMELFTSFDQCLIDEVTEVQKIFKQMELAVEQHCAEKTKFETKMENVLNKNDRILTHAMSVEIVNIVVHDYMNRDTVSSSESALTFAELFETNELKAQIQEKDTVILKLKEKIKSSSGDVKERKVERKVEEIETQNLELDHKVDVVPLVPKSRKNMTAHIDYIRHTLEEAATLRELEESERLLSPLNTSLAYAYHKLEKTSVATSPSSNIDSNTYVLSSTGVALVSSASGSKSQDNTNKNRIRRTQNKAKETQFEDHPRNVKSSLNKASVVDSRATSSVIKSVSNVNSNLKCASCNGCLF
nr:hypothetical protein [Tanacetum cinerariifolium]